MTESLIFAEPPTLREHAADALRRARCLLVGPARNDLRQLAIGLRCLDLRQHRLQIQNIVDIPPGEAPLAPL